MEEGVISNTTEILYTKFENNGEDMLPISFVP